MRRLIGLLVLPAAFVLGCPGHASLTGDGGPDSGLNNDGGPDGGLGNDGGPPNCATYGQPCADVADAGCCSGLCDSNGTCAANPTVCSPAGTSCGSNTDCCSVSCVVGFCAAVQCTPDNSACTSDPECCSGQCAGTCTPLNTACHTSGNPCATSADCCSSFCNQGFCTGSSFCVQTGDACGHDGDCCSGICDLTAGALGTCAPPPTGSTNCGAGVDGTVCTDCGSCCSRLCAPYGPSGINVCQPAGGCRIDGDLCRQDSDCCGAAGTGLPGDGNVTCQKASASDAVGVCRNPMSCDPEGDVCHYQNYSTCGNSSARNDCCGSPGNSGVCQLDPLGVPRCYGLGSSCRNAGESCAFAADCCGGVPCIPDVTGALHCLIVADDGGTVANDGGVVTSDGGIVDAGPACSPSGGACTTSADCCIGDVCNTVVGSVQGTCGSLPVTDGGTCSLFGQACSATQTCCNYIPCNVTGTSPAVACPAGQTAGCSCFVNLQ